MSGALQLVPLAIFRAEGGVSVEIWAFAVWVRCPGFNLLCANWRVVLVPKMANRVAIGSLLGLILRAERYRWIDQGQPYLWPERWLSMRSESVTREDKEMIVAMCYTGKTGCCSRFFTSGVKKGIGGKQKDIICRAKKANGQGWVLAS